jgi:hypothetical protein
MESAAAPYLPSDSREINGLYVTDAAEKQRLEEKQGELYGAGG